MKTWLIRILPFVALLTWCFLIPSLVFAQQSERDIAKDMAKTCLKGKILQCFYKALTLSPSAGIDDEKVLKIQAEHAKQCNQVLEKLFPRFRERYLIYARLSGEVSRKIRKKDAALASMSEEINTVESGIRFCIRTIKRVDNALGAHWEEALRKLRGVERTQAYNGAKGG